MKNLYLLTMLALPGSIPVDGGILHVVNGGWEWVGVGGGGGAGMTLHTAFHYHLKSLTYC